MAREQCEHFLKSLRPPADGGDMEPVGRSGDVVEDVSRIGAVPPPPPPLPSLSMSLSLPASWSPVPESTPSPTHVTRVVPAVAAVPVGPSTVVTPAPFLARPTIDTAVAPIPTMPVGPLPSTAPPESSMPGHRPGIVDEVVLRAMLPWRLVAVGAIATLFALSALQVQRVIDGQPRSSATLFASIVAGVVAAAALLMWTYSATENARRLVAPATTSEPPDPRQAMLTWAPMMVFLTAAAVAVAVLSSSLNTPDENPSSVPLAIAVLSVLLAVPFAYWPFRYLSRVVRQIGGHSADLGRWMWVPVVLAVVGVATVAGLHAGGAVDNSDQLAPMWVVAVIAIAPCVIVLLLGWQAGQSVEEAISLAADRRSGAGRHGHGAGSSAATDGRRTVRSAVDVRDEVSQIRGSDSLRLAIVIALAGLALLSIVGAVVMLMFWMETRDSVVLASERDRVWTPSARSPTQRARSAWSPSRW